MKKITVLLFVLMFGFVLGCDSLEDALDVSFYITYNTVFDISENSHTYMENINFEDYDDYNDYKGEIKSIKIEHIKYSITSNTGGAGTGDLYANSYGYSFSTATKVARTVSFAAGETRSETEVEWLNKSYFESLLSSGRLTVWAVGNGTGVHILAPTEFKFKVTANPLE